MKKEIKKNIKSGYVKEFEYQVELTLFGKHLLSIDVYSKDKLLQHIESVVNVAGSYNNNIANVNILLK